MRYCFSALFSLLLVLQAENAKGLLKRQSKPFVTTGSNGRFLFNGSEFPLIGTVAYWLPTLASAQDIDLTLGNISQAGFNAARVWAFNDVPVIPDAGTWFQHIDSNGILTINNGTNGLQKLDTVVQLAEKHRIFLILSLTNNWYPDSSNATTPRNYLSNQYGGMDVYVRQLARSQEHDQFYINASLVSAFKGYTTQIVSRYANSSYVLAWEIANDPRCASTLPASSTCNTTTVTSWHADIAQHVQQVDPNHLISSGASGFFCADCPKLYQKTTLAPRTYGLTKKALIKEKKENLRKRKATEITKRTPDGGIHGRANWPSTPTRRQSEEKGVGSAFNGTTGVDSEDILSIPAIGFGSFQLFPDQFNYGPQNGSLTFNESLAIGLDWIKRQTEASSRTGKPIVTTAFGLVTQDNSQAFVPFNSTAPRSSTVQQQPFGSTDTERNQAYSQWIQASLSNGVSGMIVCQWSQSGLTLQVGSPITPVQDQNQFSITPNDGYSVQGVGKASFIQIIQKESQVFGTSSPSSGTTSSSSSDYAQLTFMVLFFSSLLTLCGNLFGPL